MRVLVACEYSGTVRHDAMSCDLRPTDSPGPHYQGDVFDIIDQGWDLAICHPPCTYLCNSGVRWLTAETDRWKLMIEGAVFFRRLLEAPIPRIAVENPIMHKYAASIIGRRQDQLVQPWMFGHPETKSTGLWLKNLPPLLISEDVRGYMETLPLADQHRVHWAPQSKDRWKLRSTTFPGLAEAMAAQWGRSLEAAA